MLGGKRAGGKAPNRCWQGGVWAEPPATENFFIFYLKKAIFSAFNCIIRCNNVLCAMQRRSQPKILGGGKAS